MKKEELAQEIRDRIKYFYGNSDGSFNFPNSAEGDLIKLFWEYLNK